MPAASAFSPTPSWPLATYQQPSSKKSNDLPTATLLPSLTRPSPTFSPNPSSSYLSLAASYTGHTHTSPLASSAPLPNRPSSSPTPSTPSASSLKSPLYHQQRLLSSPTPNPSAPSKPRWFTARLAPTASTSPLDFSRHQPHQSLSSSNPSRRPWSRAAMLAEIYAEHTAQASKLRAQRQRLDRQLALSGLSRGYRAFRPDLLRFLQGEDCHLFDESQGEVDVRDEDLDALIEAGGCRGGLRGSKGPAFLVYLRQLDDEGVKVDGFRQLIARVKAARADLEAGRAAAASPPPQAELTEAEADEPAAADVEPLVETKPEAEPEVEAVVEKEEPVAVKAEEKPQEVVAVVEAEPVEVEAVAPVAAEREEEEEEEYKAEELVNDTAFVEPSESRARTDSVMGMHMEGHVRHNTAAMDEAEGGQQPLSMGALIEKMGQLEEEQEKEGEEETPKEVQAAEEPAAAEEPVAVASSEWEGAGEDEAAL